jgi:malate dehydrogenase
MANRKKVTIVGAGMTGSTMAQFLAMRNIADVMLIDIIEGLPQGKALDIKESGPVLGFDVDVQGTNDWAETAGSEVVVVTSGVPRKPGMTREDLLSTNRSIVESVMKSAVQHSPEAVYIMFANPMDAMCHVAMKATGLPRSRVIGQGGMLDSSRYCTFIAQELGVSPRDVHAYVLGGHTEATMVPLYSNAAVSGVPLTALLDRERIEALRKRASQGGAEIVALLKTGSAFVAPAAATIDMVEAILGDEKRLMPCAVHCQGEFGLDDAFVGVPVLLGSGGAERIIEIPLADDETEGLKKAADAVKELVAVMGL